MRKPNRRTTTFAAGTFAVVGLVAGGVVVGGLAGGKASADDLTPDKRAQIIKDCDNPPTIQQPVVGDPTGTEAMPAVTCHYANLQDLGPAQGPPDDHWANGKEKEAPSCEAGSTSIGKGESYTTTTTFNVGVTVGVSKNVTDTLAPNISGNFGWSISNSLAKTYDQSYTVQPYSMGHMDVYPAIRQVKMDITAEYVSGNQTYHVDGAVMSTPDPDRDDTWNGVSRPMTPDELHQYCPNASTPPPSTPPTSAPPSAPPTSAPPTSAPPTGLPTGAVSIVNVGTGDAAEAVSNNAAFAVHANPRANAGGQVWSVAPDSSGRIKISTLSHPSVISGVPSPTTLSYNTDAAKTDQGVQAYAFIAPDGQTDNQRWQVSPAGADTYQIRDDKSDCLTDPGHDGGTISVSGCTGGDLQRWRFATS